jgi:hypothetical protein
MVMIDPCEKERKEYHSALNEEIKAKDKVDIPLKPLGKETPPPSNKNIMIEEDHVLDDSDLEELYSLEPEEEENSQESQKKNCKLCMTVKRSTIHEALLILR